jgi:transcriptional regulator with XRE-family HTH domain
MKDRIAHILEIKNLTATKFADELDVQRSGISHILTGRNNPSLDFVIKIKETYPEFSLDWLLLGKGPVTISPVNEQNSKKATLSLFDMEDADDSTVSDAASNEKENALEQPIDKDPAETKPAETPEALPAQNETTPAPAGTRDETKAKPRRVEKIVVLYSDQTFQSYDPEN